MNAPPGIGYDTQSSGEEDSDLEDATPPTPPPKPLKFSWRALATHTGPAGPVVAKTKPSTTTESVGSKPVGGKKVKKRVRIVTEDDPSAGEPEGEEHNEPQITARALQGGVLKLSDEARREKACHPPSSHVQHALPDADNGQKGGGEKKTGGALNKLLKRLHSPRSSAARQHQPASAEQDSPEADHASHLPTVYTPTNSDNTPIQTSSGANATQILTLLRRRVAVDARNRHKYKVMSDASVEQPQSRHVSGETRPREGDAIGSPVSPAYISPFSPLGSGRSVDSTRTKPLSSSQIRNHPLTMRLQRPHLERRQAEPPPRSDSARPTQRHGDSLPPPMYPHPASLQAWHPSQGQVQSQGSSLSRRETGPSRQSTRPQVQPPTQPRRMGDTIAASSPSPPIGDSGRWTKVLISAATCLGECVCISV